MIRGNQRFTLCKRRFNNNSRKLMGENDRNDRDSFSNFQVKKRDDDAKI